MYLPTPVQLFNLFWGKAVWDQAVYGRGLAGTKTVVSLHAFR